MIWSMKSLCLIEARNCFAEGVSHFGIVTSGYGYKRITPEFQRVLDMIDRLHAELPGTECLRLARHAG